MRYSERTRGESACRAYAIHEQRQHTRQMQFTQTVRTRVHVKTRARLIIVAASANRSYGDQNCDALSGCASWPVSHTHARRLGHRTARDSVAQRQGSSGEPRRAQPHSLRMCVQSGCRRTFIDDSVACSTCTCSRGCDANSIETPFSSAEMQCSVRSDSNVLWAIWR